MSQKCPPCGWNYVQDPTGELTALPHLSGFGGTLWLEGWKNIEKGRNGKAKGEGRETWEKIREWEGKKYLHCLSPSSQNAKYAPLTVKILCFCCVFSVQTVNVNIHMKCHNTVSVSASCLTANIHAICLCLGSDLLSNRQLIVPTTDSNS